MGELDAIDFFTDLSVVNDPVPYFNYLRSKCPVLRKPHHGAMMITGYERGARSIQTSRNLLCVRCNHRPHPAVAIHAARRRHRRANQTTSA